MRQKFDSVQQYMDSFSGASTTRKRMELIRALMFELVPNVTERISYNIPAFFVDKNMIGFFAGYDHHVSLYPGGSTSQKYPEIAKEYASGRSTLKFLNAKPFPDDVVKKFIDLRMHEVGIK